MCKNSLMIEINVIQCLLDELLDKVSLMNCSTPISCLPSLFSSRSIENLFDSPIAILNRSLKQVLGHEINTIVVNGAVNNVGTNIRNGRYYSPAMNLKQMSDLRKRIDWMERRKTLVNYLDENNENHFRFENRSIGDCKSIENIWFDHRSTMLRKSIELTINQQAEETDPTTDDDSSCARCRIYQRKLLHEKPVIRKLYKFKQIQQEKSHCNVQSSSETNIILSAAKIADRIGYQTNLNSAILLKKVPSTSSANLKKKSMPSSMSSTAVSPKATAVSFSLTTGETNRSLKRNCEDGKHLSNSHITNNNFDINQKRQKRIASPSSISSAPVATFPTTSSLSPHQILIPTWRILNNLDFDISTTTDKANETQDFEDISDEAYIQRHERCELTDTPG